MTSEYTPGPWEAVSSQRCPVEFQKPDYVRSRDSGRFVAWLIRETTDDAEIAGNARLIAAAPDLLDALRHALNFAHAMRDSGRLLAFREPVSGHYTLDALLSAAIQSATGEGTP